MLRLKDEAELDGRSERREARRFHNLPKRATSTPARIWCSGSLFTPRCCNAGCTLRPRSIPPEN